MEEFGYGSLVMDMARAGGSGEKEGFTERFFSEILCRSFCVCRDDGGWWRG